MVINEKNNLQENIYDIDKQITDLRNQIKLKEEEYKNKLVNKRLYENLDYDFHTSIEYINNKIKGLENRKKELVHMLDSLI